MTKLLKLFIVVLLSISLCACSKQESLKIHIISDLHYAPKDMFEYVGDFKEYTDSNGTAKQIQYQDEIFDAYINEELENKPDYVLITGDLVYSSTYKAHERFAEKFKKLIDNGIKILIIPGNHDFDYVPYYLEDSVPVYSSMMKPEQFIDIYNDFGYGQALSKDEKSLSYSYKLNSSTLLIALDTMAEYGRTDGKLKDSTIKWIEEQLQYAKNHKMNAFFIGHHNVLLHNPMFDYGYRLDNDGRLISLMNKYDAKLYISGHMHIQDIAKENDVTEILTEAFTLYPHRYGELSIVGNNYSYETVNANITKYIESNDENLINYDKFGKDFYYNNFLKQILSRVENLGSISEEELEFYNTEAKVNGEYFAGIKDGDDYSYILDSDLSSEYIKGIIKYLNKDKLSISGTLN